MKETTHTCSIARAAPWLVMCALVALAMMPGCASKSDASGAGEARNELVTESDESAQRKRARIRVELALGYLEQGKLTIALDEIKQSIVADPSFSDAYSLRGLIYMRLNEYAIAEESFNKALSLKPQNPDVLHNLGWLKCQQGAYEQAVKLFTVALADPLYGERTKTYRALGLCQERAGLLDEAIASLLKSYAYDAGNPITGYNLANVLYKKGDFVKAQLYVRLLNNSDLANAESLWLGIKVERQLANPDAMKQLATQLEKRFAQSREATLYRRGAFDE